MHKTKTIIKSVLLNHLAYIKVYLISTFQLFGHQIIWRSFLDLVLVRDITVTVAIVVTSLGDANNRMLTTLPFRWPQKIFSSHRAHWSSFC